jgi:OmpA-OmpF porin, OOP family
MPRKLAFSTYAISPAITFVTAICFGAIVGCAKPAKCPLDADGDGYLAQVDRCPNAKEDGVGPAPRDGCPHDPDGDGIVGPADECPFEPETKNGYADTDGCPDTVPEPEKPPVKVTPNKDLPRLARKREIPKTPPKVAVTEVPPPRIEVPPPKVAPPNKDLPRLSRKKLTKKTPPKVSVAKVPPPKKAPPPPPPPPVDPPAKKDVEVVGDHIEIKQKIMFETGSDRIDHASDNLLKQIAAVLKEHKEIELVEIAGHADKRGSAVMNVNLTKRRAASVIRRLIEEGVSKDRLRSAGYGFYCPIDPADTMDAFEKNRRVEFLIVKRSGKPTEVTWGGCVEATKHNILPPKP